jgi:hypothetical protein
MDEKDFTLKIYSLLLQYFKDENYQFFTFEEWCKSKPSGKIVILRHDVDLKAINSLKIAQIENEMGIHSTYYFRVVPESNQPDIIKKIANLGHEIGYHYEDLSMMKGDLNKAKIHFEKNLKYFREFYPVKTICMHGSPVSKFDNRFIWKEINYRDYEVIGEPYFDFLNQKNVNYFTDTARMWDGDKYNVRDKKIGQVHISKVEVHSTFDLIKWIKTSKNKNPVMITTHPQRWTDDKIEWFLEFAGQNVKNIAKRILLKIRK